MVMVPREEAERLNGLDLAEADLHDQLHTLQVAPPRARSPASRQSARSHAIHRAGHRLELQAQIALAHYDANTGGLQGELDALLGALSR